MTPTPQVGTLHYDPAVSRFTHTYDGQRWLAMPAADPIVVVAQALDAAQGGRYAPHEVEEWEHEARSVTVALRAAGLLAPA